MKGIHHFGLSVSDLAGSCSFFCGLPDWSQVRKVDEYPAIFVLNSNIMSTLWQTDKDSVSFDRKTNVALHHVALSMDSEEELIRLHKTLEKSDFVHTEFSPESLRDSPVQHMMCIEPDGTRVEFIWSP